jgi:hypothetical protein
MAALPLISNLEPSQTAGSNPTFSWSGIANPDKYMIWVREGDAEFDKGYWYQSVKNEHLSAQWDEGAGWENRGNYGSPTRLKNNMRYYWRVWACQTSCRLFNQSSFLVVE